MKSTAFHYFYSNLLDQNFAIHKKNYTIHFQDGTKYTEEEALILAEKTDQEKINLHNLKIEFFGIICDDGKIKPVESNTEQGELEL